MKIFLTSGLVLSLAVCVGCESNPPTSAERPQTIGAPPPPTPAAPSANAAAAVPLPAVPAGAPATATPPQLPPALPGQAPAAPAEQPASAPADPAGAPAADGSTLKKAEVGVGVKGKDYEPGFITTPIAAKFRI